MKKNTLIYFLFIVLIFTFQHAFSQRTITPVKDWNQNDMTVYCGEYSLLVNDLYSIYSESITISFNNGNFTGSVFIFDGDEKKTIPLKSISLKDNLFTMVFDKNGKETTYKGRFLIFDYKVKWDVNSSDVNYYHRMKGLEVNGNSYYEKKEEYESVVASSTLIEPNRDKKIYAVSNLSDHIYATAWVEGVAGTGIGQSIKFTFKEEFKPINVQIINGYAKSQAIYLKNTRPSKLKLIFSDGSTQIIDLKDISTLQTFPINSSSKLKWIKIEILNVYKGTHYDDTCISEIMFE